MSKDRNLKTMLNDAGFDLVEIISERRGSIILEVKREGEYYTLKTHTLDEGKASDTKSKLLSREIEILSSKPEITKGLYRDHGIDNGRKWMLVRKIHGSEVYDKAKEIREKGKANNETVEMLNEIVLSVTNFYSQLFSSGYLHGDVQPAHTFYEDNDIVVVDWGLYKEVGSNNPLYNGGFVYYTAPEICKGMADEENDIGYTPQAEVYAIGATLFMIYTGSLAQDFGVDMSGLKRLSKAEKLERVIDNNIFKFSDVDAIDNEPLEKCIRKSLSTKPSKRFQNPSELHQKIEKNL